MIGQVQVKAGTFDIFSVDGNWVNRSTADHSRRPMLQYLIQGLSSSTYYQLEVLASNEMGKSQTAPGKPFVILTTEGTRYVWYGRWVTKTVCSIAVAYLKAYLAHRESSVLIFSSVVSLLPSSSSKHFTSNFSIVMTKVKDFRIVHSLVEMFLSASHRLLNLLLGILHRFPPNLAQR